MARILVTAAWAIVSYLLGCVNGAYYLHRYRHGADIRLAGSGNAGARNALRVTGTSAFVPVFLNDAGKGALAVWAAKVLGLGDAGMAVATVAVVLGHVFPIQLGFRGGKGIATTLGAVLVADPLVALAGCGAAALFLLILRNGALAGSVAIAALPLIGFALERKGAAMISLAALAVIVVVAHRMELRTIIADRLREG